MEAKADTVETHTDEPVVSGAHYSARSDTWTSCRTFKALLKGSNKGFTCIRSSTDALVWSVKMSSDERACQNVFFTLRSRHHNCLDQNN